jgi:MATE family multidrug resistance protein
MEKGLLEKGGSDSITWGVFVQEVKDVCFLALPMISVTLAQYFLQIISLMMVGHLGKLALSSTAIAISLCAVSGFSPLVSLFFPLSLSYVFILYFYYL